MHARIGEKRVSNKTLIQIQNVSLSQKIFRYMNLSKFISMLRCQSLWFSSGNELAKKYDIFEGYYPIGVVNQSEMEKRKYLEKYSGWDTVIVNLGHSRARAQKELERKYVYINCWHANDIEYPFMWKLYSQGEIGIAIESTVQKLRDSLELSNCGNSLITPVIYYDKEYDEGSMRFPINQFLYKRKYFEYEKEIRVLFYKMKIKQDDEKYLGDNDEKGWNVKTKLDNLITKIVISPDSTDKKHIIESIVEKYKLNKDVYDSRLTEVLPY